MRLFLSRSQPGPPRERGMILDATGGNWSYTTPLMIVDAENHRLFAEIASTDLNVPKQQWIQKDGETLLERYDQLQHFRCH